MTMGTVEPLPKTNAAADTNSDAQKKNRIQVSNTKKPLFFYVNLAKRYIQQHNEVELSALGMAITTVVTVAEILKNNGYATEKKVITSTVGVKDEAKGRMVQKARIEIVLAKTEKVDKQMAPQNSNTNVATTAGGAQDQAPKNIGSTTTVMSAAGEENKVAQLQ
ncbi:uncharacterized protein At2g34160-like [Ipomoea triloba]|uniref:uncharacterized protein At2g34160-like n=1 Tax=Ipomoea triloba TaxID=35885 RepID=UPI00125E68B5|nr:uncharacterized protein At2g34160-like [Ipomoea triloba]GMD01327.1 DNA/RNA-binding protein Alba-like protein [Ipomoea batatas]